MPTLPGLKIEAGMMPILHSPAVITPGQFGPISRDFEPDSERFTFTMSSTGMPSVMQTISAISASIASSMASAAPGGGTQITLASQPVFSLASCTVSNTGRLRCVEPPLPGEVPPTILVPYAIACSEWKVPFLPVKPWQMTLVFLSIRTDMVDDAFVDDREREGFSESAGRRR